MATRGNVGSRNGHGLAQSRRRISGGCIRDDEDASVDGLGLALDREPFLPRVRVSDAKVHALWITA
jgi:hypothetical protein